MHNEYPWSFVQAHLLCRQFEILALRTVPLIPFLQFFQFFELLEALLQCIFLTIVRIKWFSSVCVGIAIKGFEVLGLSNLQFDFNNAFLWHLVNCVLELQHTSCPVQLKWTFARITKILREVRHDLLFTIVVCLILAAYQVGIDKSIDPLVQLYALLFFTEIHWANKCKILACDFAQFEQEATVSSLECSHILLGKFNSEQLLISIHRLLLIVLNILVCGELHDLVWAWERQDPKLDLFGSEFQLAAEILLPLLNTLIVVLYRYLFGWISVICKKHEQRLRVFVSLLGDREGQSRKWVESDWLFFAVWTCHNWLILPHHQVYNYWLVSPQKVDPALLSHNIVRPALTVNTLRCWFVLNSVQIFM